MTRVGVWPPCEVLEAALRVLGGLAAILWRPGVVPGRPWTDRRRPWGSLLLPPTTLSCILNRFEFFCDLLTSRYCEQGITRG